MILLLFVVILTVFYRDFFEKATVSQVCFETCYEVEVADTDSERERGLMYRDNLGENQGMLFIYSEPGIHSFWMKNTLIPLDIIWLNTRKEVVSIRENVLPCGEEQCQIFKPENEATYVLEVKAGEAAKKNIKIGDWAEIK